MIWTSLNEFVENSLLSDTKIVDSQGKPLIVFRTQKNSRIQTVNRKSGFKGIYFSADKESTKIYGNITKEYYQRISNVQML